MASYTLGDRAARQIAELIRAKPGSGGAGYSQGGFRDEMTVVGRLDTTMARNGTATLSVYAPNTSGGIGTDTTLNFTIIDVGMIPSSASPIPSNTVAMAHYARGSWVLGAFDCDAV